MAAQDDPQVPPITDTPGDTPSYAQSLEQDPQYQNVQSKIRDEHQALYTHVENEVVADYERKKEAEYRTQAMKAKGGELTPNEVKEIRKQARMDAHFYRTGGHGTRGQFRDDGTKIRTAIDDAIDKKLEGKNKGKWIPGDIKNPDGRLVGATDEAKQRFQELHPEAHQHYEQQRQKETAARDAQYQARADERNKSYDAAWEDAQKKIREKRALGIPQVAAPSPSSPAKPGNALPTPPASSPSSKGNPRATTTPNVNAGLSTSKFLAFDAKTKAFQQSLQAQKTNQTSPPPPKDTPTRPVIQSAPRVLSGKQKAVGIGLTAGKLGGIVGSTIKSEINKAIKNKTTTTSNPSGFLKPAKERWEALLNEYPELDKITEEGFIKWLPHHAEERHPLTGKALSMDDWRIDRKAYEDYQKMRKQQVVKKAVASRQTSYHEAGHGQDFFFDPYYLAGISTSNQGSIQVEGSPPPPPPSSSSHVPSSGGTPSETSPQSPPSGPSGPPSQRGRRGLPQKPGPLNRRNRTALKIGARVAPFFATGPGQLLIGAGLLIFVIFAMFADEDNALTFENTKQSSDVSDAAEVVAENAPDKAFIYSDSTVAGASTTSGVLALRDVEPNTVVRRLVADKEAHRTYSTTVKYNGVASDVIVTYNIPSNAFYISAEGNPTVTKRRQQFGQSVPAELQWSVRRMMQDTTQPNQSPTPTAPAPSVTGTSPAPSPTGTSGSTTGGGKVNVSRYTQSPYFLPSPNGPSDETYDETEMARLNKLGALIAKHQAYLVTKSKGAAYVDPFLSVIWNGAIENISGNQFFYNCYNDTTTLNNGCDGYSSGNWQVGWGMQVSQAAPHIAEDFDQAYGAGSSGNAGKVQQVGQAVINVSQGKITYPRTFPSKSLTQLVQEAPSNRDSRQALAILLMDDELGAISMAREVAADIAMLDNWRRGMEGWGSYYSQYMQTFSNRMAAIAEKYSGISNTTTGNPSSTTNIGRRIVLPPTDISYTIVPLVSETIFINNPFYGRVVNGIPNQSGSNITTDGDTGADTDTGSPVVAGDLLGYADAIAKELRPGIWNFYNKMQGDVQSKDGLTFATKRDASTEAYENGEQLTRAGLYWCTFIVIDSYNLVGKRGLLPSEHLAVMSMIPFFKKTSGYKYLDYDREDHKKILQQVKPGYAWFMMAHTDAQSHTGQEHTGLVKSIDIDANGNGEMVTYESNSNITGHTFPIENWNLKNGFYPFRGFGGT